MNVALPSLESLPEGTRLYLRETLIGLARECHKAHKQALGDSFTMLASQLDAGSSSPEVEIESFADLDDGDIEMAKAFVRLQMKRTITERGSEGAGFFADVLAGLSDEEARRRTVLREVDRAMSWYERETRL